MYSPGQGRFISRDPIGVAGGLNVFDYCGNDPINMTDPSGLAATTNYSPGKQLAGGTVNQAGTAVKLKLPILNVAGILDDRVPIVKGVGFPDGRTIDAVDFSKWSRGSVRIAITGESAFDITQAEQMFKLTHPNLAIEDFTIHHDPLNMNVIEVPTSVGSVKMIVSEMHAVSSSLNNRLSHTGSNSAAARLCKSQGVSTEDYRALAKDFNNCLKSSIAAEESGTAAAGTLGKGLANSAGITLNCFAVYGVYMTLRDATKNIGADFTEHTPLETQIYFADESASVFTIDVYGGLIWQTYKANFVAGQKAGTKSPLTQQQVDELMAMYHRKFGTLIPAGWLSDERFIPGTDRKTLPIIDEYGAESGWVDESGRHFFPRLTVFGQAVRGRVD